MIVSIGSGSGSDLNLARSFTMSRYLGPWICGKQIVIIEIAQQRIAKKSGSSLPPKNAKKLVPRVTSSINAEFLVLRTACSALSINSNSCLLKFQDTPPS